VLPEVRRQPVFPSSANQPYKQSGLVQVRGLRPHVGRPARLHHATAFPV